MKEFTCVGGGRKLPLTLIDDIGISGSGIQKSRHIPCANTGLKNPMAANEIYQAQKGERKKGGQQKQSPVLLFLGRETKMLSIADWSSEIKA